MMERATKTLDCREKGRDRRRSGRGSEGPQGQEGGFSASVDVENGEARLRHQELRPISPGGYGGEISKVGASLALVPARAPEEKRSKQDEVTEDESSEEEEKSEKISLSVPDDVREKSDGMMDVEEHLVSASVQSSQECEEEISSGFPVPGVERANRHLENKNPTTSITIADLFRHR
ncbi:hypothetical protein U1Q18_036437 [Sarracenia purpurea var. burkii]